MAASLKRWRLLAGCISNMASVNASNFISLDEPGTKKTLLNATRSTKNYIWKKKSPLSQLNVSNPDNDKHDGS